MFAKIVIFLVVLVAVCEAYCPTSCVSAVSGCGECEIPRQQSCCHIFNRQQCNLCPSPYIQPGYGLPVAASTYPAYSTINSAPSYPAIPITSAQSYPALPLDVASPYNTLPLNTGYSSLPSNVALPYNNLAPSFNDLNVASPYNFASNPDVASLYGTGAYPAYPNLNVYNHQLAGAPAQTFPLNPLDPLYAQTNPISRVGKQLQPGLQPDGSIHIASAVPQKSEPTI